MKVMIPVNEDKKTVCVSFGRAPFFLIVDGVSGEKNAIVNEAADAQGGAGVKAAQTIVDNKADVLLTPRCGENAAKVLNAAGITMYKTTSEDVEMELKKLEDGKLEILTDVHKGFHHADFK